MSGFIPQKTIHYKTYVKTASVEAFRAVFAHHKDEKLRNTFVTIDYPKTEAEYPSIIIRFFERNIFNAGVGHVEHIQLEDGGTYKFKHYFYKGDLEFAILALSSLDRDLLADSLVQTIAMGDLEDYTNRFFSRIYADGAVYPDALSHFISINSDSIMGFGETQQKTPWESEDSLVYQTSYRASVFGEFYSLPPDLPAGLIEKVIQYPYIAGIEAKPQGDPGDGAVWVP